MSYILMIVIAGHAYLSYETYKTYDACIVERDRIASLTFVASCLDEAKAFGPPGTVR